MENSNNDLLRKQSEDPKALASRGDRTYFSGLKIGTMPQNTVNGTGYSFSTGNASEEPHSAASFSANAAGSFSQVSNYHQSSTKDEMLTPTLPGGNFGDDDDDEDEDDIGTNK